MKTASLTRLMACVTLLVAAPRSTMAQDSDNIRRLLTAFDILARRDLWPGFRPEGVPLAIYDGTRTWLVRHPVPTPEFQRVEGIDGLLVMPGRHPEVRGNTSVRIGGRATATINADFRARPPARWAPVLVHEAFHVFQRARHPAWSANEVDLFTYPFENAQALAGRRLEFEALRRALGATAVPTVACWARVALVERAHDSNAWGLTRRATSVGPN